METAVGALFLIVTIESLVLAYIVGMLHAK